MRIFTDKKIRNQLIILTLLFSFIELVGVLIGTLNTLMINPILPSDSTAASQITAAIGLASQIFLFLNIVVDALVFISNTFYSQHYGRGDITQIEKDFYFCQRLAILIGFIFFILSLVIPKQLIGIFTDIPEVIQIGGEYLRIFGISFLFVPFIKMNYSLVKNTRLERQATLCSIITLLLVVILNSIFLYGLKLGPLGAALSIVLARFVELAVTTVVIKTKCVARPHFIQIFYPDFTRFKTSSKIMAPVFTGKIFWGLGTLTGIIIIGLFNDEHLDAANQLMLTAQNIVTSFSTGISVAVGVIIGRELGANRLIKVHETSHDILKFCFVYGLILIGAFLLFLPIFCVTNPALTTYLAILFLVQAAMYIPRVYNSVIVNGILYSGGDTVFPCFVDALTYWVTVIPLSIVALKFNWHPIVPIILVQLEEAVKIGLFYYRYRKFKWVKNLTNKGGFVFK